MKNRTTQILKGTIRLKILIFSVFLISTQTMFGQYDVDLTDHPEYGYILTDQDGNSLYFFTLDAFGDSECTGGCLENWPLFYAESLSAGEGLDESDFSSVDRGDGVMQTTYKGWPLYYFVNDEDPGDVNGENVNGVWYVAKPDYTIMLVNNQLVGNDGINYKGDYTEGDEVIQYFTDDRGITLYTWINDNYNKNNFTADDFGNNAAWPVYEESDAVVPSSLDNSIFSVIDVYGRSQLTYKGWPLYYFGGDNEERGMTKGVSVPSPGVWPVAVADMEPAMFATVVDIIVGSEDHETLATAVTAAGLVETLQGEGPFTVFAPTDAAFDALSEGTLEALLDDAEGALTDILLYHVVAGKAMSADLSDGQEIETVFGANIIVTINNDGVFINDAQVTVADLEAENGVVHVINAVLVPQVTSAQRFNELRRMEATIYPNPARDYVNISFQLNQVQHVSLEIYSITGEKISITNLGMLPAGDNNINQSVADLRSGTYIVRLSTNSDNKVLRLQVVD